MKSMFQNPRFREQYRKGRRYHDAASYFCSDAFREYDRASGFRVGQQRPQGFPPTCMIQVGGDGVSLLNFGQRTATIIGVRCEELPPESGSTMMAWRPVIIIEGPLETTVLHEILHDMVQLLCQHAPMKHTGQIPLYASM